jgi:hypothetical protein
VTRRPLRRGVLAILFAVAAGLATALPASAATGAGGFTILGALDGAVVHHCEVIGSADGYQAVVCVDITTGPEDDNQQYYAKGAIEVYCQKDSGVTVQCANIYAEGVFANGDGDQDDAGSYACGHAYGACPSGRVVLPEGTYTYDTSGAEPNCYLYDTGETAVWTVAYGGNTQIELPVSDKTIELDASNGGNDGINYSSGHYLVCPYNPS